LFQFSYQNFAWISLLSCLCYMPCPSPYPLHLKMEIQHISKTRFYVKRKKLE
jgi:hypothetical protein